MEEASENLLLFIYICVFGCFFGSFRSGTSAIMLDEQDRDENFTKDTSSLAIYIIRSFIVRRQLSLQTNEREANQAVNSITSTICS